MTRGLLAPLSPPEEITLRRVANGSQVIDVHVAASLCRLVLIERTASGFRLTPLGRQRYDAMPKALLLAHSLSLHAVSGYVEGLLEKAQLRARLRQPELVSGASTPAAAAPTEMEDSCIADRDNHEPPVMDLVELRRWRKQAEAGIDKARKSLLFHRARDAKLCQASRERIATSRLLLNETTPTMPSGSAAVR